MSDDDKCYAATPAETLEQHITDCRVAKNEAEWWANREILRLRAENEKLRAERDNFYIEYRMVCDEECKIVHAENEKLRTATTELLSHYYDAMRRDGYADEEVRSEHVFRAAAAALKEKGDE